jgi:hypothetical protein
MENSFGKYQCELRMGEFNNRLNSVHETDSGGNLESIGSICFICSFNSILPTTGTRGGAVVEALRHKPKGRGIDPDVFIGIFH